MTDREKAIVMAFTGVTMLSGDEFDIFHKYAEEKMGRTIWTHEYAPQRLESELKERARADFLKLCEVET